MYKEVPHQACSVQPQARMDRRGRVTNRELGPTSGAADTRSRSTKCGCTSRTSRAAAAAREAPAAVSGPASKAAPHHLIHVSAVIGHYTSYHILSLALWPTCLHPIWSFSK